MRVQDVMTRDVETAKPETALSDVAACLWSSSIGGIPVIDEQGRPLGVISRADLLKKDRADGPRRRWRSLFSRRDPNQDLPEARHHSAGESMSSPAITIDPGAQVSQAAELMLARGVNRLPVATKGRLVGIITRHDLVGAMTRADAELEQEIREEVLAGLNWPDAVQLKVQNGDVTLKGQVDSVRDATTLPNEIRRVFGVISVDAELSAWDPGAEGTLRVTTRI
jgi:CBS domain-containing protein